MSKTERLKGFSSDKGMDDSSVRVKLDMALPSSSFSSPAVPPNPDRVDRFAAAVIGDRLGLGKLAPTPGCSVCRGVGLMTDMRRLLEGRKKTKKKKKRSVREERRVERVDDIV